MSLVLPPGWDWSRDKRSSSWGWQEGAAVGGVARGGRLQQQFLTYNHHLLCCGVCCCAAGCGRSPLPVGGPSGRLTACLCASPCACTRVF
jgi:hypothetical protein